ncbi:hypothetical protein K469DRAFT_537259, partial [Zopfia rhizophila CBS 207.26]
SLHNSPVYLGLRPSSAKHKISPLKFPPSPAPIPILCNLHQIPPQKSFLQFAKWRREYGPIVGPRLGPQNAIVLNSWRAVRDLLDRRGSVHSSRPDFPIV